MSLSTLSDEQPSIVVAAGLAPRTLRNSRRFTPAGAAVFACAVRSCSVLIGSVVTCAAIVSRAERRIRLADVAVDAPSHVERRCLIDLLHVLYLAVTRLAGDAGVDVPHVREVDVLRELVDADPRHRFLLVPECSELLNLRFVVRCRALHHRVATHASANRGQPWIE